MRCPKESVVTELTTFVRFTEDHTEDHHHFFRVVNLVVELYTEHS